MCTFNTHDWGNTFSTSVFFFSVRGIVTHKVLRYVSVEMAHLLRSSAFKMSWQLKVREEAKKVFLFNFSA